MDMRGYSVAIQAAILPAGELAPCHCREDGMPNIHECLLPTQTGRSAFSVRHEQTNNGGTPLFVRSIDGLATLPQHDGL
jgi:hypothetical protein